MRFIMQWLLSLLCLTIFTLTLYGEEKPKEQTLFGNGEVWHGGYGAGELKLTQLNGELGLMVGGRGGWIINSVFSIGGAGYGLVTNHKISDYYGKDSSAYLRLGYGGVYLMYINQSDELIHFTVSTLIGAGSALYTKSWSELIDHDWNYNKSWNREITPFFIIEPGIGVELNLTSFMRIELGASYRIVSGVDMTRTKNSDITGPSGNLAIKIGKF